MTLRYEPDPATQPYTPVASMSWFRHEAVPKVAHHRSMYLHVLQVTLENEYDHEADQPPHIANANKRAVWSEIQNKVFRYWLDHRDDDENLERDHRLLLWQLWARMQFALQRRDRRMSRAHKFDFVLAHGLRAAGERVSVRQYTVSQLWRAVVMLLHVWNSLKYTEDLSDYVGALATQCGRYFWISLPDGRVFDHPSCVSRVADVPGAGVSSLSAEGSAEQCFCVNEYFTVEMERMFFGLLYHLDQYATLVSTADAVAMAPPTPSYASTATWLDRTLRIEAIREFVARDFEDQIYERRALLGEVERFAEADPHAKATAYNAIARMRPAVIDDTAELIDDDATLDRLLRIIRDRGGPSGDGKGVSTWMSQFAAAGVVEDVTPKQDKAEAESDADELAVLAAGYLLDEAFLSESIRFESWFVCRTAPIPRDKRAFPVLVRVCNSWHVSYGGRVWLCEDAVNALACWVRQLCEEDDEAAAFEAISHVAPRREPFYEAYRAITDGSVSELERRDIETREHNQRRHGLPLPDSYLDEG